MSDEGSQVYRDLMRLKPDGWTANAWAVNAGVSRTVWSDMRKHGNPSRRTLRKLLAAAGSSLAEFEALRVGETRLDEKSTYRLSDQTVPGWRGPSPTPLPLIATKIAQPYETVGKSIQASELNMARIIDRLPRPSGLEGDPDAYAISLVIETMWPRFRLGRRLAVSPKADVAAGDDVLIVVNNDPIAGRALALIGELVVHGARFVEIRQFNPASVIAVNSPDVLSIHKVMGELF